MLKKIFGSSRNEVTGVWGKLHNEELHDLFSSPNIFQVSKLRRIRWAGYVARMGREVFYRVLVGKPEKKNNLDDLSIDEMILLKCVFRKQSGRVWTGLIWLGMGTCDRLL
jgi:hypothetical protein